MADDTDFISDISPSVRPAELTSVSSPLPVWHKPEISRIVIAQSLAGRASGMNDDA
jgi:hypothetical protein